MKNHCIMEFRKIWRIFSWSYFFCMLDWIFYFSIDENDLYGDNGWYGRLYIMCVKNIPCWTGVNYQLKQLVHMPGVFKLHIKHNVSWYELTSKVTYCSTISIKILYTHEKTDKLHNTRMSFTASYLMYKLKKWSNIVELSKLKTACITLVWSFQMNSFRKL